jgi:ParB/RepB/Spo0J family partition protein
MPPTVNLTNDPITIPLDNLRPWADNPRPRRKAGAGGLTVADADADLTASIKARGILSSLVVRPDRTGAGVRTGGYLIVAGERRYRCAKAAGLDRVPATVLDLSDAEALAVALTENMQRADMHPLDEAIALDRLSALDGVMTPEALAARVGKSVTFVARRLRLLDLGPVAREAFAADVLTAGHAELLSKLGAEDQDAALPACFLNLFGKDLAKRLKARAWDELRDDVAAVKDLRHWIAMHVKTEIHAPDLQADLPEIAAAVAAADKAGTALVEVSTAWNLTPADRKRLGPGVLTEADYKIVGTDKRGKPIRPCATIERAVIVHGAPAEVIQICRDPKCARHYPAADVPAPKDRPLTAGEKADRARAAKQRAFGALRNKALRAAGGRYHTWKITPALVRDLTSRSECREIQRALGLPALAGENAAAYVIGRWLLSRGHSRAQFAAAAKLVGFDLAKFERAAAARPRGKAKAGK